MGKRQLLEIKKDGLFLGGEPFYLVAGDFHYFRTLRGGWERRLQLMKDFGLTAVQIYVPWNMHECNEGEFNFEGDLDLAHFLKLCDEYDLKVMFRPSGYMCAEWEFGGLPAWLMKYEDMAIRTTDPEFMTVYRRYMERLTKEFIPYLSTNGGPIIAVAVENEYGSFGDDYDYIKQVGDMLVDLGVDVPLFTANGHQPFKMLPGTRPEYWTGIDGGELLDEMVEIMGKYQPDKPIYFSEFWAGHYTFWGSTFGRKDADEVAVHFKDALFKGAYVSIYTFCGGTNFGFYNAANEGKFMVDIEPKGEKYAPFITSYDYDSLVTEYGMPTDKYFKCKAALEEFTGNKIPMTPYEYKAQEILDVKLTQSADILENLDNITANRMQTGKPMTMEKLGQNYGFIMYTTFVKYTDDWERQLTFSGLHDRALVFANGKYVGKAMRDRVSAPIRFKVPKEGVRLDILVENMGRVSYGHALYGDKKGICGFVKIDFVQPDGVIFPWNYSAKTNWTNSTLPLEDLSRLDFSKTAKVGRPAFFKGSFKAQANVDTFISMKNWEKGVVWINGFNLGRYWNIGPQETLYIPADLVKEENEIVILELLPKSVESRTVDFVKKPVLDTVTEETGIDTSYIG